MEGRINRQWTYITEFARRGVMGEPNIRNAVAAYCAADISQTISADFVSTLEAVAPELGGILGRSGKALKAYLNRPPIPCTWITPDVGNAVVKESDGTARGLYPAEKALVLQRAKFARDVNSLGLLAQLLKEGVERDRKPGVLYVGNKARIVYSPDREEEIKTLLDPRIYTKRIQVKDRVYKVETKGRAYILKERKTPFHRDTFNGSDAPSASFSYGLSAEEEFEVAFKLAREGGRQQENTQLLFERPVAHVRMLNSSEGSPLGKYFINDRLAGNQNIFQFVLYDYEPDLVERDAVVQTLSNTILADRLFLAEFEAVQKEGESYLTNLGLFSSGTEPQSALQHLQDKVASLANGPALDFASFAQIKAYRMRQVAEELLRRAVMECGFQDTDKSDSRFRIGEGGRLAIVGLDFEYFVQRSSYQKLDDPKTALEQARDIFFAKDEIPASKQVAAAYFALVALENGVRA